MRYSTKVKNKKPTTAAVMAERGLKFYQEGIIKKVKAIISHGMGMTWYHFVCVKNYKKSD